MNLVLSISAYSQNYFKVMCSNIVFAFYENYYIKRHLFNGNSYYNNGPDLNPAVSSEIISLNVGNGSSAVPPLIVKVSS